MTRRGVVTILTGDDDEPIPGAEGRTALAARRFRCGISKLRVDTAIMYKAAFTVVAGMSAAIAGTIAILKNIGALPRAAGAPAGKHA